MLLSDLIYQTIKGCIWVNREISKEKIIDGSYLDDVDLGTFVNNVYVALNDAISLAYTLDKVEPVIFDFEQTESDEYDITNLDIEKILNIYTVRDNKHKNYSFHYIEKNLVYVVFPIDRTGTIYFEVIRRIPLLDPTVLTISEIDLMNYGITNNLANICSLIARAKLYSDIDYNVSYTKEQSAISLLNALPTYGDKKLHTQEEVGEVFHV